MGNKVKKAAFAAMIGTATLFGGCLSLDGFWGRQLMNAAFYAGYEYVLDNDAVFDLFEDGEPTPDAEDDDA